LKHGVIEGFDKLFDAIFRGAIMSTISSSKLFHRANPRGEGMDSLRRLWLPLLAVSFLIPAQGTEVGEGVIQGVPASTFLRD
jgi:hypothetical protein